MRVTIRTWPEKIEVASKRNYFNPVDHEIVQFRRADDAMRWLKPHLANNSLMKELRQLLATEKIPHAESLNYQQVSQLVSTLLFQNRFVFAKTFLLKREPAVIVLEEAPVVQAAATSTPSAPERQQAQVVVAAAPEPADTSDYVAQAATLVAAAENGTPFCEECEKAKKEKGQRNVA